ncbi:MAG: DNA polymerase III [Solirubrobacterales bacterium]
MAGPILPAPPPLPQGSAAQGAAVAVQVVGEALANLEAMQPGDTLTVVTQARALKGLVEVMAEGSDGTAFTLKLPPDMATLPAGARLVLQMVSQGRDAVLRMVALNNRPLAPGPLPAGAPTAGAGPLQGQPAIPTAMAGMPGLPSAGAAPTGILATILRPAPAGITPPGMALPAGLPPGTQVTVRIAGIVLPSQEPSNPIQSPAVPTGQPPASVPQGGQVPATPGTPHPPGAPAAGPVPVPVSVPQAASSPVPSLLTGRVTAHPPGGQAVVQTPAGTLLVPTPIPLPPGTRVDLEVVGPPQPPAMAAAPEAPSQGLGGGEGWPAMTEAADTLAGSDQPKLAAQLLHTLPQANTRLAAALSVFAGAIRNGDTRAVLAEAVVKGLEKAGRRDLADRLRGDVESLAADAQRPLAGGEWRGFTLPFLNGGAIEAIRLFVRQAGDEGGRRSRGGGGDDQRFILEVTMSRLGRVQLDGLVQRADKQFDLIVRTEVALEADMRRDIIAIFSENGEVCGIKGSVTFQAGGRFIDLPPDPPAPTALMA